MLKQISAFKFFMTACLSCLVISSCKKNNSDNPNSIVGKWKMTAYIHEGADVYGTVVGPCIIDNIFTFSSTNIVSVDEGPTKCEPTAAQIITGTYSINNNQTEISFTRNGSTDTASILTLNSTTLKLKQLINDDIETYTRQ